MNEVKVKVWTGTEMLGPFDLSQNPEYWANKMQDGKILLYTGLNDAAGNEIYVGDIYQYGMTVALMENEELRETIVKKHAIVELRDGMFMVDGYALYDGLGTDDNPTIVGNIYENPKLLKGGTE